MGVAVDTRSNILFGNNDIIVNTEQIIFSNTEFDSNIISESSAKLFDIILDLQDKLHFNLILNILSLLGMICSFYYKFFVFFIIFTGIFFPTILFTIFCIYDFLFSKIVKKKEDLTSITIKINCIFDLDFLTMLLVLLLAITGIIILLFIDLTIIPVIIFILCILIIILDLNLLLYIQTDFLAYKNRIKNQS